MTVKTALKRSRGRPKSGIESPGTTVQALDRGLTLMSVLSKQGAATLTDLALRTGMPPSSAYRLLVTMQKHEFAEFDDATQEWMIGVGAFQVGTSFVQRTSLIEVGRSFMHRLMEDTGETANLAIGDRGDVVFIGQVETQNPIRAFFLPGTRSPMHASGIGKALLAELPQQDLENLLEKKGLTEFTPKTLVSPAVLFADLDVTRQRGWSLDDEERYSGMRCVAAPIYNAFGEAIAGISVSGPTVRFPDHIVSEIGPKVRRAAAAITERMGGSGHRGKSNLHLSENSTVS